SAFQAASAKGHGNIAQLLIEHGANVNAQGGEYGSALQAALQSDLCLALTDSTRPYNERIQSADNVVQILRENGARELVDTGFSSESTASGECTESPVYYNIVSVILLVLNAESIESG
ncbi:hypothetical protein C8F04DRAFT_964475, partial [Mycena alexandri]